jgi:hypothetical protein
MSANDSPPVRIALASDIAMKYGALQQHAVTAEEQTRLRELAESDSERMMEPDELAREVICRERKGLRAKAASAGGD